MISLEPIVTYPSFPFYISQKHENLIKKELSKVLRCRTSLAILLVQINSINPQNHFPSLLGPFEDQIITFFRESDTVIGIDDRRMIILGFATDRQGVIPLQSKTRRVMKQLLGNDVAMDFGYSIFPEDGQTIAKLMYLSGTPRKERECHDLPDTLNTMQKTQIGIDLEACRSIELTPIQLCLTKARGRIFKRLLSMDPRTLWLGLSRLPQTGQREFLARLPFDSLLTPELDELIKNQPQSDSDQSAENYFSAVIHQMELETGIAKRNILMEKVL